jgi:hypothetical protein
MGAKISGSFSGSRAVAGLVEMLAKFGDQHRNGSPPAARMAKQARAEIGSVATLDLDVLIAVAAAESLDPETHFFPGRPPIFC